MDKSEPTTVILEVAVAAPLMALFDYLPPADWPAVGPSDLCPGMRVRVPFGRGKRVGVIISVKARSELPIDRLRCVQAVIDLEPVLPADLLRLLAWASAYYQHPPGEVIATALPKALREGKGLATARTTRRRARKGQSEVSAEPPSEDQVAAVPPTLNSDQAAAVAAINATGEFRCFLLDGVTGSGKTEVYLRCISQRLAAGLQCLVLVPEIGLTPQLLDRFRRRFPVNIAVLHSGLADGERLRAFTAARDGSARIVIGTRSAVFTPLKYPGLLVVDEEHDASYKQQDGFRYSARDLAVWRARTLNVPVVLGSATPALESVENARAGRYQHLVLPSRAGAAVQPTVRLVDMRAQSATAGMSQPLLNAIRTHLEGDGQVLIFLNRRGYAPTLICTGCGLVVSWRALRCAHGAASTARSHYLPPLRQRSTAADKLRELPD
ncbi:MAG: primosomal protein N' [Gammaproteobacteria bacterium]